MRKKFVQFAALLLAFCLIPLVPAHAAGGDTIIRVGLYYGSSALDGANLENSVGSGYRFGYYDSDNQFTELADTAEEAISVVKTTNVYYGSYNDYTSYHEDLMNSRVAVGCYHLQLPDSYRYYDDALEIAEYYDEGFVAYIGDMFYVRVGNYLTKSEAERAQTEIREDTTIEGTSSYGVSVVITGTDTIVFQYDDLGRGTGLGVEPNLMDEGEKYITWFKGYRWYGGFRYERINGGDLTVVNLVPMEDYINCVISREMGNSFPLEALKAQAVAARSYAVTNYGKHTASHFDICGTTHCQVYYGMNTTGENTIRAVEETWGEYAWYDGEICQTFYHSCDGGATENSENVWTSEMPYLRGVDDPYESLIEDMIPGYHWTKTYTGKELQTRMIEYGKYTSCGEVVDVQVTKTTPTGNVYSVTVTDINGKKFTVSKDSVRTVFGVSSLRYTISGGSGNTATGNSDLDSVLGAWAIDGNGNLIQIETGPVYAITGSGIQKITASTASSDGSFVFSGTGKGHNVGMSQWGAYAMAEEGYTYQEILKFYFTGVEIYQ